MLCHNKQAAEQKFALMATVGGQETIGKQGTSSSGFGAPSRQSRGG